ncbi:TrmH family RNA methyltransferase [Tindallia californiensis]|uniref:RNA methyltransferase, TrmH family n=1 Tax=Tindallia californiensis TaxID=159292 RepID=A0A1H3IYS8_9FIRM|nr:RNA methyltransferase [Tindallia californiensis]SDY32717.1 RNA methyltransferase, TrmH family [Tindallia californiensis]
MKEKTIESTSNIMVKKATTLHLRKHRKKSQQFLLEGAHGIKDALKSTSSIECVFYDEKIKSSPDGKSLIQELEDEKISAFHVTEPVMKKIADTSTPQGIVAIVSMPVHEVKQVLENSSYVLILDAIQDPGNMGTLIRSADAAGFDAVILMPGCTDPYSSKCIRSATGAMLFLPVVETSSFGEILSIMEAKEYHILGAALTNGISYTQVECRAPIALIIGNESKGICPDILTEVHQTVTIPMLGKTQSVNAAIAGSILMFHLSSSCRKTKTML